jgi:hypothetical protein
VHLPYVADQVLVGAAESLGHRWWTQGARIAHFEPRECIPLDAALQTIHERLCARQSRFGSFCVEDVLGSQLPIWIKERFAGWQKSRMFQRPIVTIDRDSFSGVRGFKHAWREGVTRLTA